MKNKVGSFFKLVFYEFKKLCRSPIILAFLILGPILMQICVGFVVEKTSVENVISTQDEKAMNSNISFVKEGEIDDDVNTALKAYIGDGEIHWKTDLEQEIVHLQIRQTLMVLFVDTQQDPQEIKIYYDSSNILSYTIASTTQSLQQNYAYVSVLDFLDEYFAISIDEKYFHLANFDNLAGSKNFYTQSFPGFFAVFLAFVLMVGISFSIARDNETQVFKQLCYMPISTNRYLFVKGFLYFVIGLIDSILMLLVSLMFGLQMVYSVWVFMAFVILFILSFITMSMLFATTKNQISSVSLTLLFVLVPTIVGMQFSLNNLPIALQIILLLSPLTSFLEVSKTYLLYGVFNYIYIIVMAVEMIVYYILAVVIIKHKTGIKRQKVA